MDGIAGPSCAKKKELKAGKLRSAKTTPAQFHMYINMLEQPYFRENKKTPDNPQELNRCWKTLVENLNASGGPKKTEEGWKRIFTDWKSQVRKRARVIKNSFAETGNNGDPEKPLTEVEKKLLYLTGDIVVEGIAGVPDIGVENELQIEKALNEEKVEENKMKEVLNKTRKSMNKNENDILSKINLNLEKLINIEEKKLEVRQQEMELRKQTLEITRLKFQLRYNVNEIIQEEENDENR